MQHEIPTPSKLMELLQDTERAGKTFPGLEVVLDMPAAQLKWILETALAASIMMDHTPEVSVNITGTE